MPGNNVIGAGNQQERLGMAYWISGFTDGEGCFTVSVIRNSTTRFGKQIFPEFVIKSGGVYAGSLLLGSLGLASASTIIAAIIAKTRSRGTLYAVLLFPLLIIPLMMGMSSTTRALEGATLS